MKQSPKTTNQRVREQHFSWGILVSVFAVLAALATSQMMILGPYINYEGIPKGYHIAMGIYWLLGAAGFTFMTTYQINHRYEKPMRQFAEATRLVANGDFSVYVKPRYTAEKWIILMLCFWILTRW